LKRSSPQLEQIIEKGASQDILDPDFSRSEWVEEKEELPDGCTHVEGMEGLLQAVQLRQSLDELQDVIF